MFLLKTSHSRNELFLRFSFYLSKYQELKFSSREKYHAAFDLTHPSLPRVLQNEVPVTGYLPVEIVQDSKSVFPYYFNQNSSLSEKLD